MIVLLSRIYLFKSCFSRTYTRARRVSLPHGNRYKTLLLLRPWKWALARNRANGYYTVKRRNPEDLSYRGEPQNKLNRWTRHLGISREEISFLGYIRFSFLITRLIRLRDSDVHPAVDHLYKKKKKEKWFLRRLRMQPMQPVSMFNSQSRLNCHD